MHENPFQQWANLQFILVKIFTGLASHIRESSLKLPLSKAILDSLEIYFQEKTKLFAFYESSKDKQITISLGNSYSYLY
jgi:hypothetical protein